MPEVTKCDVSEVTMHARRVAWICSPSEEEPYAMLGLITPRLRGNAGGKHADDAPDPGSTR
jgi:hypothetical protein